MQGNPQSHQHPETWHKTNKIWRAIVTQHKQATNYEVFMNRFMYENFHMKTHMCECFVKLDPNPYHNADVVEILALG